MIETKEDQKSQSLLILNPDATIKAINQTILDLLGYQEIDLLGRPASMLFSSKSDISMETLKEVAEGDLEGDLEMTCLTKEGKEIPVIFSVLVAKDAIGKVNEVVFLGRESSRVEGPAERVEDVEEDVKVYREGMKTSFGTGFNGLVLDEDRTILKFSKVMEMMTGWKTEDAIKRYCREVLSSFDCDQVCPTKEVFKDGKPHSVEIRHILYQADQADQTLTLMIMAAPIFDKAGKVIASVELIKDITGLEKSIQDLEKARAVLEKKVAERTSALKESEKKYRNLVEGAPDGFFVLQDGKFVFVNKAFCKISGYTAQEAIGTNLGEFIDPDSLANVVKNCQLGLEGKPARVEYELEATHKDGHRTWVEVRAEVGEYEGKIALIGILMDINRRRKKGKEMHDKIQELEGFTRIAVDREERMNELKQKIKSLEERLKAESNQ